MRSDMDTRRLLDDALELAALQRPTWPEISARIRATGVPRMEDDTTGGESGTSAPAGEGASGTETGSTETDDKLDHEAEAKKWKALARKHENAAKASAQKVKEYEDADKSETQKATDKAAEADKRAAAAERTALQLEVALDKAPEGMSIAQVRKLAKRLTGENREDLEADAAELFADFATGGDGGAGNKDDARRRPRERLRSGTAPAADPEETDPEKLAAQVPRMY